MRAYLGLSGDRRESIALWYKWCFVCSSFSKWHSSREPERALGGIQNRTGLGSWDRQELSLDEASRLPEEAIDFREESASDPMVPRPGNGHQL